LRGPYAKCHPLRRTAEMVGRFTGRVYFRGEHGFTRVRMRHAYGRAGTHRELRCQIDEKKSTENRQRGGRSTVKALFSDVAFFAGAYPFSALELLNSPSLLAASLTIPHGSGPRFGADTVELHRGMLIARIALARGNAGSLTVDEGGRSARIRPPLPFGGTATLKECPVRMWGGRLKVRFPGKTVTFTGRGGNAFLLPRQGCGRRPA
jgi:hypothetical protein